MQNKRMRILEKRKKTGIIQTHIMNNLRNYVVITIIFLSRSNTWSTIYKQCKRNTRRRNKHLYK